MRPADALPEDVRGVCERVADALALLPRHFEHETFQCIGRFESLTPQYQSRVFDARITVADLRLLLATVERLAAERNQTLQALTDEQRAHGLTATTLAAVIREKDKAERYRVERDKAVQELRRIDAARRATTTDQGEG